MGVELTDAEAEPTPSSISYQLAHETAHQLELRGDYRRAADLLAVALVEEAQRTNQRVLRSLDLMTEPENFRSLTVAMAEQQLASRERAPAHEARNLRLELPPHFAANATLYGPHLEVLERTQAAVVDQQCGLRVPLLDEREPPLFASCLASLARKSAPRAALPRPQRLLDAIASRWSLPTHALTEAWREFVEASGGAFTLSLPRARLTLLEGQPDDVAEATWRLALMDRAAAELIAFDEAPAAPAAAPVMGPDRVNEQNARLCGFPVDRRWK